MLLLAYMLVRPKLRPHNLPSQLVLNKYLKFWLKMKLAKYRPYLIQYQIYITTGR